MPTSRMLFPTGLLALALGTGCESARVPSTHHSAEQRNELRTPTTGQSKHETIAISSPWQLPKPDLARLRFDPTTRTLELYQLDGKDARWMLVTPADPRGVPVDRLYQFPTTMDLDLDRVGVFYILAGRTSPSVTLREILDSRNL